MITCKYVAVIPLLLVSVLAFAKGENNPSASQFITNSGQITDQYYQLRDDIDAKIEANGVTMFVGSGQLHYQFQRQNSNVRHK